jgi:hypothetical protein
MTCNISRSQADQLKNDLEQWLNRNGYSHLAGGLRDASVSVTHLSCGCCNHVTIYRDGVHVSFDHRGVNHPNPEIYDLHATLHDQLKQGQDLIIQAHDLGYNTYRK